MMEEAQRSMDRIVIQDHGTMIADGTSAELVTSCFGDGRTLRLTLDCEPKEPLPAPWVTTGREVTRGVDQVADVPVLLNDIASLGYKPQSLEVAAPSLQEVFIKLTGRELRE
jgi:ABC-2 type transport system ATP-binding protein